jgi:hypothetical protein
MDPNRKLIFIDDLPDPLEHGNWKYLIAPLERATKEYERLLREGAKFRMIIARHGSLEVIK